MITKTHDHNTLAVLGHEMACIDDTGINRVPERLSKFLPDNAEGAALVITFKIFDVLKHECGRAVMLQNTQDIEEQRALSLVLKSMQSAKSIVLRHASY